MMHVNPWLEEKALAMVYNPTARPIAAELTLPLYYTGLADKARIREQRHRRRSYALDRDYSVRVPVDMAPRSITWFVVEK